MVNLLFIWLFVSMGSLLAECCTYLHTGWHDFATGNLNFPVDVIYQNVYKHIVCMNLFCNWFFVCLNSGRYTEILHSGVQLTFCSVQILGHDTTRQPSHPQLCPSCCSLHWCSVSDLSTCALCIVIAFTNPVNQNTVLSDCISSLYFILLNYTINISMQILC